MTAPRARWTLLIGAGLLVAAAAGSAAGADLSDLVAAYLKAGSEQAPGAVTARAYFEPSRPTAAPAPQAEVSVVLLPYSAQLASELDAVKAGLRDSPDSYIRAPGQVEAARVDFERALVAAGGGTLVRSEITDGRGSARLAGLPAGDWMLLAWREGGHVSKRFKISDKDARRYPDVPTSVTYSVLTYWRSRFTVRPSETIEVSMTDRNVWMTGGRQESRPQGPSRDPTPGGGSQPRR